MNAEKEERLKELKAKQAELEDAREKEPVGKKKGAITKQINSVKEEIEKLENGSGDGGKDETSNDGILIKARSTTGFESYRRAGIGFTNDFAEYKVSKKQLEILQKDKHVKLEIIK